MNGIKLLMCVKRTKKFLQLKILGTGDLKKSVQITANFASKKASEKIEKAGGSVELLNKLKK